MDSLWLDFKASPGADIEDCCIDAVRIAKILGVTVWFDFNGVRCAASRNTDPKALELEWRAEIKSDNKHRVASA